MGKTKINNKGVTVEFKVKIKIPCVTYKDLYIEAPTKKDAKTIAKSWIAGENICDSSGDYDFEQLYHKSIIQSIIKD